MYYRYCHERFFDGLVTLVEWDTPMQVTETLAFSLAQYETLSLSLEVFELKISQKGEFCLSPQG